MPSRRVCHSFLYGTADFLAFVLVAGLELIADFLAPKGFDFFDFLQAHELLFQIVWVEHFEAGDVSLFLPADTYLFHQGLTLLTVSIVA